MSRRRWYLIMNAVVAAWLLALAVVVVAHRWVPASGWLMVHMLLLGAVSTAILIWSQHFADALLRRPAAGGRASLAARLAAHTVGAVLVLAGMLSQATPLVLAGAIVVAANALAHAALLARQLGQALAGRFAPLIWYYVAASLALVAGVAIGMAMSTGGGADHDRLFAAHVALNVFGWIGLTVIGTVVLLWPTVLRTRVLPGTDAASRRALPLLAGGTVLLAVGSVLELRAIAALGILAYLVGLGWVLLRLGQQARQAAPITYAGWSMGAALAWFAASTVVVGVDLLAAGGWGEFVVLLGGTVPMLAVGFAAQIVLGALSYLLPVVLGGGPEAGKASARELDRGSLFRVIVINGGILLYLLPLPGMVRVALAVLVCAVLASFLVLAFRAVVASRMTAKAAETGRVSGGRASTDPTPSDRAPGGGSAASAAPHRRSGMVTTAAGALMLALAVGVAMDPAAAGISLVPSAAGVGTGHTTTIDVTMAGMRFHPDVLTVPRGDRLVVKLTNHDDMVHDLVLANGAASQRVAPGQSATLDAGVITAGMDGWCSIPGHRQLGMVLKVVVTGSTAQGGDHDHGSMEGPSAAGDLDMMAEPGAAFVARDASLPPASEATVHKLTLTVRDTETEVAPGVTQDLWTYNGTAPGPTLRGKVGDVFEITLVNDASMEHSIDFHAGALAPDRPMRDIAPGESLTYRFTATRSGIWLYHCATMPMSLHLANGMFGAVIIDPPGLDPVDQEFVLVQSEYYLGPQGGIADAAKVATEQPDLVVFNGYANQYRSRPIAVTAGERVRIWVLDAGPNVDSAFHVVGGQFDTVYKEGDYLLRNGGSTGTGGSQVLGLMPAQGGFVELTFPEAGHYPFVSHIMSDSEKGAYGVFDVTP